MSDTFLETARNLGYDHAYREGNLEAVVWTVIEDDDVHTKVVIKEVPEERVDEALDVLLSFALFHLHHKHYVDKDNQQDHKEGVSLVYRGLQPDA